jgi:hypothetical protein
MRRPAALALVAIPLLGACGGSSDKTIPADLQGYHFVTTCPKEEPGFEGVKVNGATGATDYGWTITFNVHENGMTSPYKMSGTCMHGGFFWSDDQYLNEHDLDQAKLLAHLK